MESVGRLSGLRVCLSLRSMTATLGNVRDVRHCQCCRPVD